MNQKNKIFLFFGVILVILVLQRLYAVDNEQTVINDRSNSILIDNPKNPKIAGYWDLDSIILIDGEATGVGAHNWTWVEAQDWFGGGSGNSTHPYLFENITISVNSTNPGLTIANSTVFFKLSNITITNVNDEGNGLYILNSGNGTIVSSDFINNGKTGIYMDNVNDTRITLVNCINNTEDGIYAVGSNLNTFTVDSSYNGRYGLLLANSDNNTMSLCEFTNNTEVGLAIVESGEDNSTNNEISENTFENNGINAVDNCTLNSWDDGAIGNVWDDYEGVDADDDLIGDTPYDISGLAGAQDNYPYCDDGTEVAVSVSGNGDGDRDLYEPVDILTLIAIIGIFFGIFIGILAIGKFLISNRR